MRVASRDLYWVRQVDDGKNSRCGDGWLVGAMSKLSVAVTSPATSGSVAEDGAYVVTANGDLFCAKAGTRNADGGGTADVAASAVLVVVLVVHAEQGTS